MAVFEAPDFDGHEHVAFAHDKESGLKAIVAIHNTHLGPSLGGCRMFPYASDDDALRDVLRLSRGMSYKSALAGLPLGGGKSVIIGNPQTDKSPQLFQAMGAFVEKLVGQYIVAQDAGISVEDLQHVAQKTQHVAGVENAIDDHQRVRSGDPSPATAYGVFVGIKAAVKHRFNTENLNGIRVAIQGVGNVGFALAKHLHAEGAKLFVSDVNPANVKRAVDVCDAVAVSNDEIAGLDVDVYAPCALGGAINANTINIITAPVIAGCANNQLDEKIFAETLRQKNILYAPDYVINAGGVIHVHYMRTKRTWEESTAHVENIAHTLEEIFVRADKEGKATDTVANIIAEERLYGAAVLSADVVAQRVNVGG
ncbi:Leucine dehydrogenase [Thalassocella blandensis]|nr:Leucine dehydrogenase [Thalassocella blandensis]